MAYKYPTFGELIYASYSGLQALAFAVQKGLRKYDRGCYAFRESVIKKYRAGEMRIGDLYENNIRQMMSAHDTCWYCGCPVAECGALTADHIFPRAKGVANVSDNLIMVCRSCNSSKGTKDLLQWFYERGEFPPMRVLAHYLKLVNQYAIDHGLLDRSLDDLAAMGLPFEFRLLPLTYPQPEEASFEHAITSCKLKLLEPVASKKLENVCRNTISASERDAK